MVQELVTYAIIDVLATVNWTIGSFSFLNLFLAQAKLIEQDFIVAGKCAIPLSDQLIISRVTIDLVRVEVQVIERVKILYGEMRDALNTIHDLSHAILKAVDILPRRAFVDLCSLDAVRISYQSWNFWVYKYFWVG